MVPTPPCRLSVWRPTLIFRFHSTRCAGSFFTSFGRTKFITSSFSASVCLRLPRSSPEWWLFLQRFYTRRKLTWSVIYTTGYSCRLPDKRHWGRRQSSWAVQRSQLRSYFEKMQSVTKTGRGSSSKGFESQERISNLLDVIRIFKCRTCPPEQDWLILRRHLWCLAHFFSGGDIRYKVSSFSCPITGTDGRQTDLVRSHYFRKFGESSVVFKYHESFLGLVFITRL